MRIYYPKAQLYPETTLSKPIKLSGYVEVQLDWGLQMDLWNCGDQDGPRCVHPHNEGNLLV